MSEAVAPAEPLALPGQRGLSAHAQALWLAGVRFRMLADRLAMDSAAEAAK